MKDLTVDDLLLKIGQQSVQIDILTAQIRELTAKVESGAVCDKDCCNKKEETN